VLIQPRNDDTTAREVRENPKFDCRATESAALRRLGFTPAKPVKVALAG